MPLQAFSTVLTTHAVPQRVTSNTIPAQPVLSGVLAGSISPRGCWITLQAPHTNTAGKYIYVGGPSLSVAAKTGIALELLTGGPPQQMFLTDGTSDLADIYFDTDAGTDGTEKLFVGQIG